MSDLLPGAIARAVETAQVVAPWIPFLAAVGAAIAAGVFTWLNRRGGEKSKQTPTWVELVTENRALRADLRAAASDLRAATVDNDRLHDAIDELRGAFEKFRDDQEVKGRAIARVLKAAADEWPTDHPGPTFELSDLDVLADTIPEAWRQIVTEPPEPRRPTRRRSS